MGGVPNPDWTAERVALVTKLWLEGKSASEIATILDCGFSRNSIIGKVHRLGLANDNRQTAREPRPLRTVAADRPEPPAPKKSKPVLQLVKPAPSKFTHCTLIDLKPRQCRWPINQPAVGEGADMLFCDRAKAGDGPYCAEHQKVAFAKPLSDAQRAHLARMHEARAAKSGGMVWGKNRQRAFAE